MNSLFPITRAGRRMNDFMGTGRSMPHLYCKFDCNKYAYMHRIYWLTIFLCAGLLSTSLAQKPKSDTYTYAIAWDERGGETLDATCTLIIKGDSIKVVHKMGNRNGIHVKLEWLALDLLLKALHLLLLSTGEFTIFKLQYIRNRLSMDYNPLQK